MSANVVKVGCPFRAWRSWVGVIPRSLFKAGALICYAHITVCDLVSAEIVEYSKPYGKTYWVDDDGGVASGVIIFVAADRPDATTTTTAMQCNFYRDACEWYKGQLLLTKLRAVVLL